MNTGLKVLGGIALIMVIVFCAIGIWTMVDKAPNKTGGTETAHTGHGTTDGGNRRTPLPPPRPEEKLTYTPIRVKNNDPLQPQYTPINKPTFMQEIRMPSYTYTSRVAGTVKGRASDADWGIKGEAYFMYIYGFTSTAKVLKNDGLEIIEERTFSNVVDKIIISDISIGFELGDRLRNVLDLLGSATATAINQGVATPCPVGSAIDGKSVKIKDVWVNAAKEAGIFKNFPLLDPDILKSKFKMLSKKDGKLLLAGKTVKITYIDGQGVQEIEPINCGLSEREIELIKRTNYLMDHYIFPDRQVGPGDQWVVDGSTFAGLIDPELSGKVNGEVNIIRQPDFPQEDGDFTKRLKILGGNIIVRDDNAGSAISGELTGLSGRLIIPDKEKVVTKAFMKGYADYKKLSTNHLLFQAKMTVKPVLNVRYECEVSKTK